MRRIVTDQPSSGKPLLIYMTTNNGFINTSWTSLIEAPYFSVPSTGDVGIAIDPLDGDRELRPGEIFFETPLGVTNTTTANRWVELQMLIEPLSSGSSAQAVPVTSQVRVPPLETIYLPIQGLRLLKTGLAGAPSNTYSLDGGILQIRAEVADALTCLGSVTETAASDHEPDTEP